MAKSIKRVSRAGGTGTASGTMAEINKQYGEGTMCKGSRIIQPDRIPLDIFMLDFALLGGLPVGRSSMVVGERHAGKSTIACKATAGAQRYMPDSQVAYMDIEGTLDMEWAQKLGVSVDDLIVTQPESGEAAVDIADALIHTEEISLLIVDSVAALTPMKEITDSAEDAHVGIQARLMGNMIRKVTQGIINERRRGHQVTILYVNQYRTKIGGYSPHGEARSIPGGKALEFATSVQFAIKNKENQGKDSRGLDLVTVNEHAFTIQKNKLNNGARTGEFRLNRVDDPELGLSEGDIDDAGTMLAYAKKFGIYTGGGSSWTLDLRGTNLKFRGTSDAVSRMYEDREIYYRLRNYLIALEAERVGMPDYFISRFDD